MATVSFIDSLGQLNPMAVVEMVRNEVINLASVFWVVGSIMALVYGGPILSHHDDVQCTVWSLDGGNAAALNVQVNIDIINALMYSGLGAIGIYMRWGLMATDGGSNTTRFAYWFMSIVFGFGGAVLVATAVWKTQMAVLTGSCTVTTATDNAIFRNGQIHNLPVYAGTVLALLLSGALHRAGPSTLFFWRWVSYWNTRETVYVKPAPEVFGGLLSSVTRAVVSWLLFEFFYRDHAVFASSYVRTPSAQCTTALGRASLDPDDTRMFQNIEVGHYNGGVWETNKHLQRLTWSIVVFSSVELGFRCIEIILAFFNTFGSANMNSVGTRPRIVDNIIRMLGLVTDVIISVFIYSFLMVNEVSSCALLDPSHWDVRVVYSVLTWFLVQTFLAYWLRTEYGKMLRKNTLGSARAELFGVSNPTVTGAAFDSAIINVTETADHQFPLSKRSSKAASAKVNNPTFRDSD